MRPYYEMVYMHMARLLFRCPYSRRNPNRHTIQAVNWLANRWLWVGGVVLTLGVLPGCELFGFLAHQLSDREVKAQYELPNRLTLVLVDDPSNMLGNSRMSLVVADEIAYRLEEKKAVKRSNLVPARRLAELAVQLGGDFARTPVDQIGRSLDAQQVIYVYIESATLGPDPGLYRPQARVQVKVVDVADRQRLFPPAPQADQPLPPSHYPIDVKIFYRAAPDNTHEAEQAIRQMLATRIGRDVARLFFDYTPGESGEKFDW